MKKIIEYYALAFIIFSCFTSCIILKNKWEEGVLKNPGKVKLIWNNDVDVKMSKKDSKFNNFNYQNVEIVKDSLSKSIEKALNKRNIYLSDQADMIIEIDNIKIYEESESVIVDALGSNEPVSINEIKKTYTFGLEAFARHKNYASKIQFSYQIVEEPRESLLLPGMIHTPDKFKSEDNFFSDFLNIFSYRIFSEILKVRNENY